MEAYSDVKWVLYVFVMTIFWWKEQNVFKSKGSMDIPLLSKRVEVSFSGSRVKTKC